MLERLAMSLGFSHQLRHIETVTATGAELQANPEMATECLKKAWCSIHHLGWVRAWLVMRNGQACRSQSTSFLQIKIVIVKVRL
jgi:hypothetical protein